MQTTLDEVKEVLRSLILDNASNSIYSNASLRVHLDTSPLFSPIFDQRHPIYILIHNGVPELLVELIKLHVSKHSTIHHIIDAVMLFFENRFYSLVWLKHTAATIAWEKSSNVYEKKKRLRRNKRRAINKKRSRNDGNFRILNDPIIAPPLATIL